MNKNSMVSRVLGVLAATLLFLAQGAPAAAGIIVNGDFSAGVSGFSTGYSYQPPQNFFAGQYFIGMNPHTWNFRFSDFADHTTGLGNMLMLNGALAPNVVAWQQTVFVEADVNYTFSFWAANLTNDVGWTHNAAALLITANDAPIGMLTPAFGSWTNFYLTGDSTVFTGTGGPRGGGVPFSGFVTFKIIDTTTQFDVNDFALDDISFNANLSSAVPEPSSITLFGVTAIGGALYGWRRRWLA